MHAYITHVELLHTLDFLCKKWPIRVTPVHFVARSFSHLPFCVDSLWETCIFFRGVCVGVHPRPPSFRWDFAVGGVCTAGYFPRSDIDKRRFAGYFPRSNIDKRRFLVMRRLFC